jgi:hypothetical protein
MQGMRTRFAVTADPNGGDGQAGPTFDRAGDRHRVIADPIAAGSGRRAAACDFWDGLAIARELRAGARG